MSLFRPAKAIGELNTDVGNYLIIYHSSPDKSHAPEERRDFFLGVRDEIIVSGSFNCYGKAMFLRPEGGFVYGEYVNPELILISAE